MAREALDDDSIDKKQDSDIDLGGIVIDIPDNHNAEEIIIYHP